MVEIVQQPDGSWRYLVNGEPDWPIGIGYNPVYRYLPEQERRARYHRDFRMFRDNGITLLVMWTAEKGAIQDPVDELLMNTAAEYGLGAVVPFYFPVKENMANPIVRRQMREHVIETVTRWKDHPATRMWGLGNEVLLETPIEQQSAVGNALHPDGRPRPRARPDAPGDLPRVGRSLCCPAYDAVWGARHRPTMAALWHEYLHHANRHDPRRVAEGRFQQTTFHQRVRSPVRSGLPEPGSELSHDVEQYPRPQAHRLRGLRPTRGWRPGQTRTTGSTGLLARRRHDRSTIRGAC
ncbi:MAG: hypothetical protein KatS3mg060_3357 [Dehalococcoidia bacterium]|nr:MAG: hypothetical protein KatS3mg060_3357 [Dehalococcoidia bacterium]